jgi:hypothetical protein
MQNGWTRPAMGVVFALFAAGAAIAPGPAEGRQTCFYWLHDFEDDQPLQPKDWRHSGNEDWEETEEGEEYDQELSYGVDSGEWHYTDEDNKTRDEHPTVCNPA